MSKKIKAYSKLMDAAKELVDVCQSDIDATAPYVLPEKGQRNALIKAKLIRQLINANKFTVCFP
jgi:hypothetical protein